MAALGFEYVTIAVVPAAGQSPIPGVLLNNRPVEYLTRYAEQNYAEKDPVVTELRKTLQPYSWSDIRQRRRLSKKQQLIMNEAAEFGSRDGMVVPIFSLSGGLSIFAPCGDKPNLSPRARSAAELIGMAAHQALRRLDPSAAPTKENRLTVREREVMTWIAAGKSDDEIGIILSISRTTVLSYVENAKRKLNASRRPLAVVEAIRRGEISI